LPKMRPGKVMQRAKTKMQNDRAEMPKEKTQREVPKSFVFDLSFWFLTFDFLKWEVRHEIYY